MTDTDPDPSDAGRPDLLAEFRANTSDLASLVADLYRGEVDRATAWRARLDQTTNWAVVVAAILTWSFSSPDNPHYVLLVGVLGVTAFLLIEAHRLREYDICGPASGRSRRTSSSDFSLRDHRPGKTGRRR